jgi:Response regulator receiver domain
MTSEILNEAPRFGNSIVSSKSKTTHYFSFRIVQYWTVMCSGLAEDAGATFATAIGRHSSRKAVEQNRSKHVTAKPKQGNPFCDWMFNMQRARNRILCVDDHEDSRGMMKVLLEMWNYEVTLAIAADDGLYLARSEPFDLYLLDAHLPGGSAFELCEQICRVPGHAPVVLISTAPYYYCVTKIFSFLGNSRVDVMDFPFLTAEPQARHPRFSGKFRESFLGVIEFARLLRRQK